jgi:NDP-sugar pyrophosphorylase family protein
MSDMVLVVLAGGAGKRMGPAHQNIPKHLLEVDGRPLFLRSLENFIQQFGVQRVIYRIAYRAEIFAGLWADGQFRLSVPTAVLVGELNDGPIGALASCLEFIRTNTFVFVGGDILYDVSSVEPMLCFHSNHGVGFTVGVASGNPTKRPSTLWIGSDRELERFERPDVTQPEDLINASLYLVEPEKVGWLLEDFHRHRHGPDSEKEYKEDHLWRLVLRRPDRARLFRLPGRVVNVNTPEDLTIARSLAASRVKQL